MSTEIETKNNVSEAKEEMNVFERLNEEIKLWGFFFLATTAVGFSTILTVECSVKFGWSILWGGLFFIIAIVMTGFESITKSSKHASDFYSDESEKFYQEIFYNNNDSPIDEKHLMVFRDQYEICIKSEQFYEKTMWDIGKILITASMSIYPLAKINNIPVDEGIVAISLSLYIAFLLIAKRLRASIRTFRKAAQLLENRINGFPIRFVYKFEKMAFGNPMKIWTVLMFLFFCMIDIGLYFICAL